MIEEILAAISEIDAGTKTIMAEISQIVNDSQTNTQLVEGVTMEISQQNVALQSISVSTEQLQTKVSSMENLLANIRAAITEIDGNASANEAVAEKISGALD